MKPVTNIERQPHYDQQSTDPLAHYKVYTTKQWNKIPQLQRLPESIRLQMLAVAQVLPFRVNQYVIDQLIDWDNVPEDPIFQLTFPQPGMLAKDDLQEIVTLLQKEDCKHQLNQAVVRIRQNLNPHPAGQMEHNVPIAND